MTQRVLIIEDDELLREVYATKLEMEGFAVDTAADGQEGLDKATDVEPDVILLDMIMPRMTGLEFLRHYHPLELHPKVTTLVMSNKSSAPEMNQAKALGIADYLIKSHHTPDEIVARIRTYLAKRTTDPKDAA
jgi:DNA-binding response OmpR family regulator